jgi:hypothetical protein
MPAKATLHVVAVVPPNRKLCKQCQKMNNRREGNIEGPDSSIVNPEFLLSETSPHQITSLFKARQ